MAGNRAEGLGFGVGGGVWVEADGFCGTTVVHGSREDQAGKGYFLVCDGVGDTAGTCPALASRREAATGRNHFLGFPVHD